MDEMTFMEFMQEMGKGLWEMPAIVIRLYTQRKTLVGWMLTVLITTCLVGIMIAILSVAI
jgi:hypothetical protein